MSATVFIEKEQPAVSRVPLKNSSGADLADQEFAIIGLIPCVAEGAIANNADGSFLCGLGAVMQINQFATSEDTFGTVGAPVYFDPSAKLFSDTKKAGYKLIGQVQTVKTSGVVKVALFPVVAPTFAQLADVDVTGVTDNDTLKFVASTGQWTDVAV